jgi:pimeloyl-ACP methyl ester carboxylesterase
MEIADHDGHRTAFRWTAGREAIAEREASEERSESVPAGILYVHGSGATHRVWAPQYAPDGTHRPAVALDLSGHDGSEDVDTAPGPETLAAYVDDVAAVAAETNAGVLVGNSLGGAVVLQAVLAGAVSPGALVLVGTGATLGVHEHLRELLADDFEGAIDFLHGDDRLFHDADARALERSRAEMRDVGQRVTRRDFLTCHEFDVRDCLDEITAPTLAVCGERDQLTSPDYHEYLAENVEDGRHETVPDAAHLVMVERPGAFNEVLVDFLGSVDALYSRI